MGLEGESNHVRSCRSCSLSMMHTNKRPRQEERKPKKQPLSCAECRRHVFRILHTLRSSPPPHTHRLKLKVRSLSSSSPSSPSDPPQCDRVFPCQSCSKRGCAEICPDGMPSPPLLSPRPAHPTTGALTSGKGSRSVSPRRPPCPAHTPPPGSSSQTPSSSMQKSSR